MLKNIVFKLLQLIVLYSLIYTSNIYSQDQKITLWDQVRFHNLGANQTFNISSGTGFFVAKNYIITNEHVVSKCRNIAVRGAIKPSLVKLIASDKELDLAVLYSKQPSPKYIFLRDRENLEEGDDIFVVGYPLNYGQLGQYLIKSAKIIRINEKVLADFSTIEFTNVINQGNSGGPLLDKSDNVIGVVQATKTYYDIVDPSIIYETNAESIGLDALKFFLNTNGIVFLTRPTYRNMSFAEIDEMSQQEVVNIHCVH